MSNYYLPTQERPPPHRRFNDKRIPAHITYAYKKAATIAKNDDFYKLPETGSKQIDVLFLIANAPVKTASFPVAGSESYVGLAEAMELAMNELLELFPAFFVEEAEPSKKYQRYCTRSYLSICKHFHSIPVLKTLESLSTPLSIPCVWVVGFRFVILVFTILGITILISPPCYSNQTQVGADRSATNESTRNKQPAKM